MGLSEELKRYEEAKAQLMNVGRPAPPKVTPDVIAAMTIKMPTQFSFRRVSEYAMALTQKMYRHYGITNARTQMRNKLRRSYHTMRDGIHLIRLGKQCLEYKYNQGFGEYKTIRFVINYKVFKGMEAMHQVILHEFAHVLARRRGYRTYGSVHNSGFVKVYREVMALFPYGG